MIINDDNQMMMMMMMMRFWKEGLGFGWYILPEAGDDSNFGCSPLGEGRLCEHACISAFSSSVFSISRFLYFRIFLHFLFLSFCISVLLKYMRVRSFCFKVWICLATLTMFDNCDHLFAIVDPFWQWLCE